MEDGSRHGKAAPVPTGDLQHHLKTRCGAVVCSCEVSGTDRADSAMGGGTGSPPPMKGLEEGLSMRERRRSMQTWSRSAEKVDGV